MRLLERFRGEPASDGGGGEGCTCVVSVRTAPPLSDAPTALTVDANDCHGGGDLVDSPGCRATVVGALADRDADVVRVERGGQRFHYDGGAAALLLAAGRFVDAVAFHDPSLAARAKTDPLAVAREAVGRAGPVARLVAETGLAACAERADADGDGYRSALAASVAPTVALGRTDQRPPADATLRERTVLATGGHVMVYDRPDDLPHYHLRPAAADLSPAALAALAAARTAIADGTVEPDERAPARAVRLAVRADGRDREHGPETENDDRGADGVTPANEPLPVETLTAVLNRHTRGLGVLDEVFDDDRVNDASLSPPAAASPLRVVVDDEAMSSNVRLSATDLARLRSRVRAESGRSFSRATPTVDAAVGSVRVAGVTAPASDGPGYAFRRRSDEPWTLPRLIAVGSLPAAAAGLLSVAVARGAAVLIAGPRGGGKTSLLGACCLELPRETRSVVIEDTPELPLAALRATGRDVQGLAVGTGPDAPLTPTAAVRTALRLGEGALVVGEVRGEEAAALYEAMRVGAAADAVLGTIHGTGAASVRERVVSDLAVPPSSFAATDLVVTLGPDKRLHAVEEVCGHGPDDLRALATRTDDDGGVAAAVATPTPAFERGESAALAGLVGPGESVSTVRERIAERAIELRELADAGRTDIDAVAGGPPK